MAHANVLGVLLMIELIINFNYATLLLLQYSTVFRCQFMFN